MKYICKRIKEIWHTLSSDKQKLVDVMLEAGSRKILGDTLTDAYVKRSQDSNELPSERELLFILVKLFTVSLMNEKALGSSGLEINRYLEEAFNIAIMDKSRLIDLPGLKDSASQTNQINFKHTPSYKELYSVWVTKTVNYLSSVREIFRMLSFNELVDLWDSSTAIEYLATHAALKQRLGCDLFRIFVFDGSYFENYHLLRRLLCEVISQSEIGINVRVGSFEKIKETGRGASYPVHAIGIYDQSVLAFIIETSGKDSKVAYIDKSSSIKEATQLFSDLYFLAAEPGLSWVRKHQKILRNVDEQWIRNRVHQINKMEKFIKLQ